MKGKSFELNGPGYRDQAKKKTADFTRELFSSQKESGFDEVGVLSGSKELLKKSDAELFPDELEEYTPEERRKSFKLHKNENGENDT